MIEKRVIGIILLQALVPTAMAISMTHAELDYRVCFTPQENCTALIVDAISHANQSIYVQAYSFTSGAIMQALVAAANRGVTVKVILDKTQVDTKKYSASRYFLHHQIPVWVDYKPAVAHNKVMVIDQATVITGSFNFTNAAQYKNAENLLVMKNADLAAAYLKNWQSRWEVSDEVTAGHHARHATPAAPSGFLKGYQQIMNTLSNIGL